MEWENFVYWAFLSLITGLFSLIYRKFSNFEDRFEDLVKSVVALNITMGQSQEAQKWQNKQIEINSARINRLEDK